MNKAATHVSDMTTRSLRINTFPSKQPYEQPCERYPPLAPSQYAKELLYSTPAIFKHETATAKDISHPLLRQSQRYALAFHHEEARAHLHAKGLSVQM